jgi:hypothetical protein
MAGATASASPAGDDNVPAIDVAHLECGYGHNVV